MEFIKFLGGCAVNGKKVAVYRNGDSYLIRGETTGGSRIRFMRHRRWETLPDIVLGIEQYEDFRENCEAGCLSSQDVRITWAALGYMGYPAAQADAE